MKSYYDVLIRNELQTVCTSLPVHRVDSADEQRTVGLWVLHEDDEQLQSCFHQQTRLETQTSWVFIQQGAQPIYFVNLPWLKLLGHVHTAGNRPNIVFSPICNSYLSFYDIINVTNPFCPTQIQPRSFSYVVLHQIYVFQGDLNLNGHADFIWLMSLMHLQSKY